MPRTSNRRWKGCGLCKPHKFAQQGDAARTPISALRQIGKTRRLSRNDIPQQDPDPTWTGTQDPGWRAQRKNTRAWCKGKTGRPHQPTIKVHSWRGIAKCTELLSGTWVCHHAIICVICGKILQDGLSRQQCPSAQPTQQTNNTA